MASESSVGTPAVCCWPSCMPYNKAMRIMSPRVMLCTAGALPAISSMLALLLSSAASMSALCSVAALLASTGLVRAALAPALRAPAGRSGDSSPTNAVEHAASSLIRRRSSFTRWVWPASKDAESHRLLI